MSENPNPAHLDSTLESLINEYNLRIQATKEVDEKANKYLMAISICIAGFFTTISSSLHEGLRFHYPLEIIDVMSWIVIISSVSGSFFILLSICNILASLKLAEVPNMPDLKKRLEIYSEANLEQYKYELICCYQENINLRYLAIEKKQKPLQTINRNMKLAISSVLCSCVLLFFIKVLS